MALAPSLNRVPNLKSPSAHPRPASPGPLSALRTATREHHDRIDRLVNLTRLQDREHYATVLQVFDAFLRAWEPAVQAALPGRREWLQARSRLRFLQHDLRVLGIAALPAVPALPAFASPAAAWGSVYVMEGSALGGQVITRSLAAAGLGPHTGAAYFHGWGEATAGLWRDARALLESALADPAALEQACDGARGTFDSLTLLLEAALHERTSAA